MDTQYSGETSKCRWNTYGTYRLLICSWMMNEMSIIYATTSIAHSAFYVHAAIHVLSVICIGIPLIYSEICIAQYTNCNIITMWEYCPLFRCVGYGTIYLILLKILYLLVVTSWYLEYTFFSALDPPPWFSCDEFNTSKCMVKRVNVSVFQHCLEAQNVFNDDCGMKTASAYFYEREIGDQNTKRSLSCLYQWKAFLAILTMTATLFLLSLKREKFIQFAIKLVVGYVSCVLFVLFCVALSTSGSWFSTKVAVNWDQYTIDRCFDMLTRGFLSIGSGSGMIVFLSRDVPFRSPATMTAIASSLLSVFACLMFALIAFSGIKTMSYFHGEEENVIEVGTSNLFNEFASVTEILSYFDALSICAFAWFSAIFICLYVNLWLLYLFLTETLISSKILIRNHEKSHSFFITSLLCVLASPFFCIDLNDSLLDTTAVIQLVNSLLFSISLYWIYGFKNHGIDIIFMIGVKSSYFWKILWIFNPILVLTQIYYKTQSLQTQVYNDSRFVESLSMPSDVLLFLILIFIYLVIVVTVLISDIIIFYRDDNIRNILSPVEKWGPKDKVLLKSRQMFLPQIMTTEFLYRQVKIHGYGQRCQKAIKIQNVKEISKQSSIETMEWSALTSN